MAIPDYQSLMLPLLKLATQGEMRINLAVDHLAKELHLTAEEMAHLLPSGKQATFANRVHWAKSYLVQAGLLQITKRAHFQITDRGREILARNPTEINNSILKEFPEFQAFKKRRGQEDEQVLDDASEKPMEQGGQTPDELIRLNYSRINDALASDLLVRVTKSTPEFFEILIVGLLLAMGYGGSIESAGRAIGKSGDDGVDGVIDQDALGLDRVYIQAKRYAIGNNIGSGAIRDFFGSLDRFKAAKGLFVTTSDFSSPALETASSLSKRIVLINGAQLASLMIQYNVGCRVEETLTIRKVDEDFFEPSE
jgi:restriction system protein